jgi:DNA-binding SARP family transcriptional activator
LSDFAVDLTICAAHNSDSMLDSDWNVATRCAVNDRSPVDYLLLGPMAVMRDNEALPLGGLRQRGVLAALLLAANRTVDTEKLIELVWDESPPPKPIASLRAYIANLRRILGGEQIGRLITDANGYHLSLGSDRLDTREFESLVSDGRRLLDAGDAARAGRVLQRSLKLWRGVPLADFRDQPFVDHEVHRLEALRADAVEARFSAELRQGRSCELIPGLEAEVIANPMREGLWGQLMLAMYRAGRRPDALHAFDRVRAVLDRELGVHPGVALERLANEIRSESADLDWQPAQATAPRSRQRSRRYSGLFGRSRELERLRVALTSAAEGHGCVAVITGDSGVGKTALATEVADMAEDLGMATVWAGHSGGARKLPSGAWAQALRGLDGTTARWTPLSGTDELTEVDLVEATANAVTELAARRPAVIVLDDLHHAGRFTHDVLELLAASVHRGPMLILATWPDGGVDRPVRARTFDRLLSRCDVTTLKLRGIDRDATSGLIEDVCGCVPTAEFVTAVQARTGGNPFYIKELTRLLHDTGRLENATRTIEGDHVPDAVAGVIRRRMAGLPRTTRSALTTAAQLGVEFGSARLAAVLGVVIGEIPVRLEPALCTGLIAESAAQPGRYRFCHGLVRDAVAAQLTGLARADVQVAIARVYADEVGQPVSADAFGGTDHPWSASTSSTRPPRYA